MTRQNGIAWKSQTVMIMRSKCLNNHTICVWFEVAFGLLVSTVRNQFLRIWGQKMNKRLCIIGKQNWLSKRPGLSSPVTEFWLLLTRSSRYRYATAITTWKDHAKPANSSWAHTVMLDCTYSYHPPIRVLPTITSLLPNAHRMTLSLSWYLNEDMKRYRHQCIES